MPVAPKDKDTLMQKSGITYRFKFKRMSYDHEYIE